MKGGYVSFDRDEEICRAATPGQWEYDWGNWQVEGPRPDRYAICNVDPASRKPGFYGQEPNPVDGPGDGEFIARFSPARVLKLIAVARAASIVIDEAHEETPGYCVLKDALAELEKDG